MMAEQRKLSRDHLPKVHSFSRIVAGIESVPLATRYGLDGPGFEPPLGRDFSIPVQTSPEDHAGFCKMCPGLFPGGKAARSWS